MTNPINQEHEEVLNFAHSLPSGLTKEQIYVRIHERARAIPPAAAAAGLPAGLVPKWAGQFDTFDEWVRRAQRVLSVPAHKPGAICVDAKGRRCHIGADMARARDEGAFPVRYFWECEVAALPADPVDESQPAGTLPALTFAELIDSDTFKHTLNELANKGNNPKHQRKLVREVREAIKACAEAQRQASVAELYGSDAWIKLEAAMPEPYEEVRILVDGVPRIGRLNHRREYFQLCTFLDNVKGQYIASFERVAGWQPLPQIPAAPAMEAQSHE